MNNLRYLWIALILVAAMAAAQTSAKPAKTPAPAKATTAATPDAGKTPLPDEDTVNSFLFNMFGYDPTVTWKVNDIRPSEAAGLAEVTVVISNPQGSNVNKLYVTSDGKHALTGEILPFGAHPFADARAKLDKGVTGPAKGPELAPVTIVEFSDMQCPHCKQAAPTIDSVLVGEPNTRFIFQNFPLPSHDWAEKAAGYVDCVGRASKDAVWKFIQKTFEEQTNITAANVDEKLRAIANDSGVKGDDIAVCAEKPDTKARVQASVELGKAVGVTGTPALFVNGRMLSGGAPADALKKIVEFQASQEEKSGGNVSSQK
jgi:protein-disulfide isomerase